LSDEDKDKMAVKAKINQEYLAAIKKEGNLYMNKKHASIELN